MDLRTANLLGALALALRDAMEEAIENSCDIGLSSAAGIVTIAATPDITPDGLSRILGITPAGVTRMVNRLQADGLVERQAAPDDARSRTLSPTKTGARLAKRVLDARRAILEKALAPLTEADRAALTRLLERMLAAVTPDRTTCDHTCRLCDLAACPQDICPVELAARDARDA